MDKIFCSFCERPLPEGWKCIGCLRAIQAEKARCWEIVRQIRSNFGQEDLAVNVAFDLIARQIAEDTCPASVVVNPSA